LKAEVFIVNEITPASIGPTGMPTFGRAKKSSSSKVTSGVARSRLT